MWLFCKTFISSFLIEYKEIFLFYHKKIIILAQWKTGTDKLPLDKGEDRILCFLGSPF
jgi:hypothetical protein